MKSLGDGFLATFDGPTRAIYCATAIRDWLRGLDVPVSIDAYTGEVEPAADDVRGSQCISHLGLRISAAPTTFLSRAP